MTTAGVDLRELVAHTLDDHLDASDLVNPWTTKPDATTRMHYAPPDGRLYTPDRLDLHEEILEGAWEDGTPSRGDLLTIVLTAGPPGAGKSWTIDQDSPRRGLRQVDGDAFKDRLLVQAREDGLLNKHLDTMLPDGRPVQLRELANFVHAESMALFDRLRDRCIDERQSFVLHSTLHDLRGVDRLLGRLAERDYRRIDIVYVGTTLAAARERTRSRWWEAREANTDGLGGRYVNGRSLDRYFDAAGEPVSARQARAVADLAERNSFLVSLGGLNRRPR